MSNPSIDARGQICPKPLIMTKQALTASAPGTTLSVLIDNETSCRNVERFLADNGMPPTVVQDGPLFTLSFVKNEEPLAAPDAAAYCVPGAGTYVVSLAGDTIGRGSPELGARLVKGLLATIKELSPLPTHLILYSSGILLAVDGSPHVEALAEIEQMGVKLLICGTCADYYEKGSAIHVGTISNMLDILEVLTRAGKIIAP